jgi:hypothetical protein
LICRRLEAGQVNWALTGSLSFALQGLPLVPGDIDLQTDAAGAYEIERRLAQYQVQPVAFQTRGDLRSHYGSLSIEGVPVEIIGDIEKRLPDGTWEAPPDLAEHQRIVSHAGLSVPVMALAYEARAYALMGRLDRARQLEEWLARPEGVDPA